MNAFLIKKIVIGAVAIVVFQFKAPAQQKVEMFPLTAVTLEDKLFLKAQQNNLRYILALEPDRLLAPFLKEAGIKPKAPIYGNWETSGLGGQTGGHYLSALSMMYAATKNPELKKRLDYMIDELAICQKKNGNGYVGGVPDGMLMWADLAGGKIEVSNFSLNKKWVPWYNMHKLYAGLIDTWLITGNLKSKQILIELADWCISITSKLSDKQMQEMLRCEQGGMNEVLAEVASITGDEKYMQLAKRFSHQFILEPLLEQKDELTGLHANTQIPKVIGFMRIGELTNSLAWKNAAAFFWETVVTTRSLSIGGNSVKEHFNKIDDFSPLMHHKEGPETCNSYNMLKLSKHLFLEHPQSKFIDYYEKTTYNHILSSQHPAHGGLVYLTPLRAQHYRVYSSPGLNFWCCVGTGIENHAKYGEMIYAHQKDDLYVNLFIASTLTWEEKGLTLKQETKFPFEEKSRLTLEIKKPKTFTINIRKPKWLKSDATQIWINDKPLNVKTNSNGYYPIKRRWAAKDEIRFSLPMETKVEPLPDGSPWVSFMYGPIVLAAATSTANLNGLIAADVKQANIAKGPLFSVSDAPVIIADSNSFSPDLEIINKDELTFGISKHIYQEKYKKLKLIPFFKLHDARYMVYWPVSKLENVEDNRKKWLADERTLLPLETSTIDFVATGEQQSEVEHDFDAEQTEDGFLKDRRWRNTTSWFSYKLKNDDKDAKKLRITHYGAEKGEYTIFINDNFFQKVVLSGTNGDKFIDDEYILPLELVKNYDGKPLTIKLVADKNSSTAKIFYIRLLK
ncbi:MAG: glycoside hydrolase family 127 protein [Oligoflexus sp.]|nr:glycoside hydrolase family 127 protein [Pseudopedobacter sp.]